MHRLVLAAGLLAALPATAETLVAARTIRAGEVVAAADLRQAERATPGAVVVVDEVVGLSARRAVYAGRPIRAADFGPPALVTRNSIVPLVFRRGLVTIAADGRALDDGALGDPVRVMNLGSRQTVVGLVEADGSVRVGGAR